MGGWGDKELGKLGETREIFTLTQFPNNK